jgi:hypothetical protein
VLKLHKDGKSLRWIVDETNLTLRTVRTIVERKHGTDRTTKARREKIEIDKSQRAHWKAQKRTGDALPKRQFGPMYYASCLDDVLREPFGDASGRREAGEVLRRLLDAGLSRFEPNPLQALERAEAEAKRQTPAK